MSLPRIRVYPGSRGLALVTQPCVLPRSSLSRAVLLKDQSLRPAHTQTGGLWLHHDGKAVGRWVALLLRAWSCPALPCCLPAFCTAVLVPMSCPQFCVRVESLLCGTAVSLCGVRCPYAVSLFFLMTLLQESAPRLEGEACRASHEPPPWTLPAAALPPSLSPLSRSLSVSVGHCLILSFVLFCF